MRTMCVVLLAIGGLAAYWWIRTCESVQVVQDQLAAIDEGRYPQSYDYLSSKAKAALPFDEFVTLIQHNTVVRELWGVSFPLRSREGETVMISGLFIGYGALTSQANYVLVLEDGQWKIDKFHWATPRKEK